MFDPKTFSFDPEKLTEFFKQNDFTKHLTQMRVPGVDPEALMTAQKKNMDALVEANKAAAAGYQDLFKRQMSIFEETMAEAQAHLKSFDATKIDPDRARAQAASSRCPVADSTHPTTSPSSESAAVSSAMTARATAGLSGWAAGCTAAVIVLAPAAARARARRRG